LKKSSKASADIRVGCSGWIYKDWAKRFYPTELAHADKLKYYASFFNTVEINNSFYRLPSEAAFKNWRAQVPERFLFAVKLSRFLTHVKRLKPDERTNEGVDRFCSRARHLGPNLGVVLVQLPASFRASEEKLANLVKQFKLAEKKYKMTFPLALECRHDSWFTDNIFEQLTDSNVASVVNSSPRVAWPYSCRLTADFAYIRFHGSKRLYSSSYTAKELERWATFIRRQAGDCKTIYCYFNNDKSAKAVENAKYLQQLL
jgi:uncharacterized protein YecE (DUF72 family)